MGVVHDKKGLTAGLGERRLPGQLRQVLASAAATPSSHCPKRHLPRTSRACSCSGDSRGSPLRAGRQARDGPCMLTISDRPEPSIFQNPPSARSEAGCLPVLFVSFPPVPVPRHREKSPSQRRPRRPFLAPRPFLILFHAELKWKCGPGRPLRPAGRRVPNPRCLGPVGADFDEAQYRAKEQNSNGQVSFLSTRVTHDHPRMNDNQIPQERGVMSDKMMTHHEQKQRSHPAGNDGQGPNQAVHVAPKAARPSHTTHQPGRKSPLCRQSSGSRACCALRHRAAISFRR